MSNDFTRGPVRWQEDVERKGLPAMSLCGEGCQIFRHCATWGIGDPDRALIAAAFDAATRAADAGYDGIEAVKQLPDALAFVARFTSLLGTPKARLMDDLMAEARAVLAAAKGKQP